MKRISLSLLAVALLLLVSPLFAQDAPDTQSGNFLYFMPTGWNPVEKDGTTMISAPAPPPGTATFIALAAHDLDGDLQNSFNELWGGFRRSYRILQGGQVTPLRFKNKYDAYQTSALAADQGGRRWTIYVMGVQYHQRLQVVTFMSNLPPGSYLSACEGIFRKFLGNLTFGDALPGANVPPPDAAPVADTPHTLPPGALEGIYIGFELSSHPGSRRLLFNPDGWVVRDVVPESMIGFDFTKYRNDPKTNRSWVGRYRVDGNQINILWQDYTEHREVIGRNETSAKPGINVYVPMCRCTGEKFSGKYLYGLARSGQYIQFFPDGTFLDHQVLDQMLLPSAYYEHPRIQRGTYSIYSQTIVFTFADGRRGTRTFYAPKAQKAAKLFDFIGLGWQILYEEHYQNQP